MTNTKTIVLKTHGISDERIQEEFSQFFSSLVEKYSGFGVGLSTMEQGTDSELEILKLADLV